MGARSQNRLDDCQARPGRWARQSSILRSTEQHLLVCNRCWRLETEGRGSAVGRRSPARGPLQKSELNEVRLVDVHHGVGFFAYSGGQGLYSDWAAAKLLHDDVQDTPVDVVKSEFIDRQHFECAVGERIGNVTFASHFGKITHALEKS